MISLYVHYGCGLTAPKEWINFDASPTLVIQRIPIVGKMLESKLNCVFPDNVLYGNIVKGLPGIKENSCNGVFCSHVLEHLSLNEIKIALSNTYKILKPGGIFRCVLPDLEFLSKKYLNDLNKYAEASVIFLKDSLLGVQQKETGIKGLLTNYYSNSRHLWMWDYLSLSNELEQGGFNNIRRCSFNDSEDKHFKFVEEEGRFKNCLAIEAVK